jgi:GNAT superfamily N-acetyltransferase
MTDAALRPLTAADLDAAFTLSSTAGWNQQLADWRMLATLAPHGSFAAESGGRIVGTAIGIDYGSFGWIAMMLVDPAFRGRGLGRQLLEAAVNAIPPDRPVRLDATPMGRPLYRSFGFEDESSLSRQVADAATRPEKRPQPDGVRTLTGADLPRVAAHDRDVFGADRADVLRWAVDGQPAYASIAGGAGPPQYCLGRRGRLFDQLGPVVAGDDETARALVSAGLRAAGNRSVVIDSFDERRDFTAWLAEQGFVVQRPLYRMCRPSAAGRRYVPRGDSGEFAIFGPDFG